MDTTEPPGMTDTTAMGIAGKALSTCVQAAVTHGSLLLSLDIERGLKPRDIRNKWEFPQSATCSRFIGVEIVNRKRNGFYRSNDAGTVSGVIFVGTQASLQTTNE